MAVRKKYQSLGRGLDALISTEDVKTQGSSTINEIPIDQIEANPNQPRREFEETALNELAQSIGEIGIVVPITLRQIGEHKYQIIAGYSLSGEPKKIRQSLILHANSMQLLFSFTSLQTFICLA